ncbi:MAG: FeoA family protein [Atopobium sp.]|uniref:FeoA family protein n=1 Tax=Atopobium sp. TaxID=1872650 RepID=UPI002A749818|nr:FeoA family protein [Atopobium sp.]MDY2787925.1 FeoA family protein [Atopobium sp.]MDY4522845.1 FeoA family protein [Atopobium sp.]
MSNNSTDTVQTSASPTPQLPLSLIDDGEAVHIARVKGSAAMRQHLSELGFVEGAEVTIVSRINGDVVVGVKGSTFGLDRKMASHIYVS